MHWITISSHEKCGQVLLSDRRVDEALDLAENSNFTGYTKDQYEQAYKNIQKQAAFIYFSMENYDKARTLFLSSDIDIREVRL
jgi:ABC-type transport system substrate-binding protein